MTLGVAGEGRTVSVRGHGVFLSTFEKQLDSKRRFVVPQDFRAAAAGSFDGVFCFPSIEADCLEGGGKALFDRYADLIEELPFGDPLRTSLETVVYGGMNQLAFDSAGRITLPESLCEAFGLTDWVVVVGLKDRFQIWNRDSFRAWREEQRAAARAGLADLRQRQRAARTGGV
nr:division/cell wall cluster transcriptional repressor MraZ [Caulobacter sp. 17J80-11]